MPGTRRVAVLEGQASRKVVLTEFHLYDDRGAQLQLSVWAPDSVTMPGAFCRLTAGQVAKLEQALHNWLTGREDAA